VCRMRPIRMGMAGGGEGAFIGEIHRAAARLDGQVELVCGAFSSDAEVSRRMGTRLGLQAARTYDGWQDMLALEMTLPANARMQFVSIVTPNHLHLPIALRALESGFHVLCEKPATGDVAEVRQLADAVERHRRCFALTHTYLGYPLVVEARRGLHRSVRQSVPGFCGRRPGRRGRPATSAGVTRHSARSAAGHVVHRRDGQQQRRRPAPGYLMRTIHRAAKTTPLL
jgi:predicted dehydrogenase